MGLADELAALDEAMSGEEPDWEPEPVVPGSLEKAAEWMTRLHFLAEQERDVRQVCATRREPIDRFESERLGIIERQREWLEEALASYMRARRAEDPGLATIHLPHGEIKSRTQQPVWEWSEGFVSWLRENRPDLLHEPKDPEPQANAVKKAFVIPDGVKAGDVVHPVDPETGESIESVTVTFRERKVSVVPS